MSSSGYFYRVLSFFKSQLLQLNLFKSGIQDELVLQKEHRSTRLYLALLIVSSVIIVFYYSIAPYVHTVVIKTPTFVEYSTLSEERLLECSCTTLAVKYEKFVQLKPFYHQLCRSYFVSDEFINQLLLLYEQSWNNSISTDFRRIAVFQFRTLCTLCQLTRKTIEDNVKIFLRTELVEPYLIPQERLEIRIDSLLADFIYMTPQTFIRTLRSIQDITAQSLLMTGASLTSILPQNQLFSIFSLSIPYSGLNYTFTNASSCICSSSTATSCMVLATFNNDIVPGFQIGCYMLNALLKSTLEVFYNQTFINMLTNSSGHFEKLNSSDSNSTIETLFSQMFVTHWSNETIFQKYFNDCAPESCQYVVTEHHNFFLIITIITGLFGGLSSIFDVIAPFIIMNIWPTVWKFITRRQTPVTQVVENGHNRGKFTANYYIYSKTSIMWALSEPKKSDHFMEVPIIKRFCFFS